jgi:superfamily II DNA/RNA helicase
VIEGRRKMHNEELRNLYSSQSTITMTSLRRMRWAGHVARMGRRGIHILLMGKPEEKRPLRTLRRRCVDNIMTDLLEMSCDVCYGLDCSGS